MLQRGNPSTSGIFMKNFPAWDVRTDFHVILGEDFENPLSLQQISRTRTCVMESYMTRRQHAAKLASAQFSYTSTTVLWRSVKLSLKAPFLFSDMTCIVTLNGYSGRVCSIFKPITAHADFRSA